MSDRERADVQHLYGTLYHTDPLAWPHHLAAALAQARAEGLRQAADKHDEWAAGVEKALPSLKAVFGEQATEDAMRVVIVCHQESAARLRALAEGEE